MRLLSVLLSIALLAPTSMAQEDPTSPPTPPPPSKPPLKEKVFYGGGVGLGFGDVDYVEVSPLVGLRVTPRIDVGVSVLFRWRSDDRFDIDTSDYGGTLFGRVRINRGFFLEADWEYLDWEYIRSDLSTDRTTTSSFLAGGGYYVPLGGRAGASFSALYNFSYDEDDILEPYGDPWVFRAGFGIGF